MKNICLLIFMFARIVIILGKTNIHAVNDDCPSCGNRHIEPYESEI